MKRFFNPRDKTVVFFDLNRTLVDPQQTFRDSFVQVIGDLTGRWSQGGGDAAEQALETYEQAWSKQADQPRSKAAGSRESARLDCLGEALKPMPLPVGDAYLRNIYRQIKDRQEMNPRTYPHTKKTLEQLAEHYRLAIISNGSRDKLDGTLSRVGLQHLFPDGHRFASSDQRTRKPKPDIFRHALRKMAVPAAQAVMVGDSWNNDILGAVGSGIDAVWIRPTHGKKSSQRKIGSSKVIIIRKIEQLTGLM